MPSPYLRSKSVQVLKKASVYAAFHCCRGVQVSPVLVRFPLFLYTCTTMKTPVFMRVCAIVVHFLIPSHGVRDRTGQAAFLRSARAGPSAKAGWRQVKVSSTFSKVVGCGTASHGLSRLRQTQENRKIVRRTVFRKKPSSGVSWAGPRPAEDFHKPA